MKRVAKKAEARATESESAKTPTTETPVAESTAADSSRLDKTTNAEATTPRAVSRHIPAASRDHALARVGYQCEFVGSDGTRCTRRTGLQVDHIHPFAKEGHGPEGPHAESNLRCLCRPHNQWCAEQEFGRDFIQAKIGQSRPAKIAV